MPPTIVGLTKGFNLYVKLTNGTTIRPAATDKVFFSGPFYGDPILTYNDSTHLANAANAHLCTTSHINNTKFVSSTAALVNGSPVTLPISKAQCPLVFEFFSLEKVLVNAAKFYVFSGSDITPVSNVNFWAAEGAVSTSWKDVNSISNALDLTPGGAPDIEQDFFVSFSMSPTAVGTQVGTFKITLTYV